MTAARYFYAKGHLVHMSASDRHLAELLPTDSLTAVVDVGANPVDGDPPYQDMLSKGLCRVTGFEPQPAALASLVARQSALERYLPYVVADGRDHVLHLTQASGMTSLLRPDPTRLAMFNGFPAWGAVREQSAAPTVRLDDIVELDDVDLLKIDVQGGG